MTTAPTLINVRTATMSQLIEFFNANTGGNPVKKFADRPTAEKRVQRLVDEIAAEGGVVPGADICSSQDEAERNLMIATPAVDHSASNARIAAMFVSEVPTMAEEAEAALVEGVPSEDDGTVSNFSAHGLTHCPRCGIHLRNGIGAHGDEVNGKYIKHEHFEYACLGCGAEFGPALSPVKNTPTNKVGPRPAMVTSLKIDRRIVDLLTGEEYANACQVWKAGLVSASQGDRLSAVLYGAFKKTGKRDTTVTLNGRTFRLAF